MTVLESYQAILKKIPKHTTLVAVTKNVDVATIEILLKAGHRHFGENKVQEAESKWPSLRQKYPDIVLHLIGGLQTNKADAAVALFDVIHSVDREKLIAALKNAEIKHSIKRQYFVQVNVGDETQKGGVVIEALDSVLSVAQKQLDIKGLMAIPPADEAPQFYFSILKKLNDEYHFPFLSMGMSDDFELAIEFGATHVRVGTAIFGERN